MKSIVPGIALLLLCPVSSAVAADHGWQYLPVPTVGTATPAPYSEALRAGRELYIAGHVGTDPVTHQLPSDVKLEAKFVMDAIQQVLKQQGMSTSDLVSVSVFCTDLKLYDAFNAVYRSYFHGPYPPRVFIGVSTLLRGAHFEVEGVALKH
jgi:2-iminobutanoate/2-iminopropanoate deaminase